MRPALGVGVLALGETPNKAVAYAYVTSRTALMIGRMGGDLIPVKATQGHRM
jgi:hypothetical protein